jgi:hypothetical protein
MRQPDLISLRPERFDGSFDYGGLFAGVEARPTVSPMERRKAREARKRGSDWLLEEARRASAT